MLTAAGYDDATVEDRREPMWFGVDTDDAFQFVLGLMGWMLDGLDENSRSRALDALLATIADHETPDGVLYESAAWVISATRPR